MKFAINFLLAVGFVAVVLIIFTGLQHWQDQIDESKNQVRWTRQSEIAYENVFNHLEYRIEVLEKRLDQCQCQAKKIK